MATFHGEPHPGFFKNSEKRMKDQHKATFADFLKDQRETTAYVNKEGIELKTEEVSSSTHDKVVENFLQKYGPDINPLKGALHLDTNTFILYSFNGTVWEEVSSSDNSKPTHPVADSYAHRFGEYDNPEVGSTHMYDYMTYVYDGSQWNLMTDEEWLNDESPKAAPAELTSLTLNNGADYGTTLVTDACATNTTLQISDGGGSFQEIDLAQMADDIESMKEMLQQLMGNKTSPCVDEESDYAKAVSNMAQEMADEIDQTLLSKIILESNKLEIDYDRAMNKMENDRG